MAAVCTGCSYLTDFVIVNKSDESVVVLYALGNQTNTAAPSRVPLIPAVKPVPSVHNEEPWSELAPPEYQFDPQKRVVTLILQPNQAVRIAQHNLMDGKVTSVEFSIREIEIRGREHQMKLKGDLLFDSFVPESKKVYTLTYN